MKYKGFEIKAISNQGCRNYIVPELARQGEGHEVAASLKMARKWVDMELMERMTGGNYRSIARQGA